MARLENPWRIENPFACEIRDLTVRVLPSPVARLIGVRRPQFIETGPQAS